MPASADARLHEIQTAMRAGDIARAGELAERALATGFEHPHVLTLAAYRRMGMNDHASALPLAERAAALNPRNVDALSAVGTCLMQLERPVEAAAAFGKALALDAGDSQLHLNAGAALEAAKEYARAVEEYEQAFTLDPANAGAAARRSPLLPWRWPISMRGISKPHRSACTTSWGSPMSAR